MIKDGLWDAFNGYHMGNTAENVAQAVADHPRAAGRVRGRLAEQGRGGAEGRHGSRTRSSPVTVKTRKGDVVVDTDEYPKHGATLEAIAKLRPAFAKDGTVTAANASGINDGAAAVVLMKRERGGQARHDAARPHRLLGACRRRSRDHGHRPDPGLARGARRRPAGRSTISI